MIVSFRNKDTEALWAGRRSRPFEAIRRQAVRKLDMLDAAVVLEDLRVPPGNHLEVLEGDRKGQHSIKVNDQWRICFVWKEDGAHDVEICDYH